MTQEALWYELYKSALLELDRDALSRRIEEARSAMLVRLEELKMAAEGQRVLEEKRTIEDSWRNLQTLQTVELRSGASQDKRFATARQEAT